MQVGSTRTTLLLLLVFTFFLQLGGLFLFTRGFLLTRLALSQRATCDEPSSCTLPATHKRAVVLIIDALRFDFISPDPPEPHSPFHHNILTLPRELTEEDPTRSFLFQAFADPPTTTLQRIKGIVTGSLPTFVDMGNNFGGSSIEEDSIIFQLGQASKRMAFMGDDTWMAVFPSSFVPNMTHPSSSLDVEDLHSVDNDVIRYLFPLLEEQSKWDFIVGHGLGVDHAGHRVGPDHVSMRDKLLQWNDVLRRVVDLLHEDTLLIVMGDHGMDTKGDHGGDDVLETASALWIYSKGPALADRNVDLPPPLLTHETFPGASVSHRLVQQIDLLPSLSLLLGLPIPFNNLGSVIPELFTYSKTLSRALVLNAIQIKAYLEAYRGSTSGSELDDVWGKLDNLSKTALQSKDNQLLHGLHDFNREVLQTCRCLWAQFDLELMVKGLIICLTSLVSTYTLYNHLSQRDSEVSSRVTPQLPFRAILYGVYGGIGSAAFEVFLRPSGQTGFPRAETSAFGFLLASSIGLAAHLALPIRPAFFRPPILLTLQFLGLFSNSFILWEDRITQFLLITAIVPHVLTGLTSPMPRLRARIWGYAFTYSLCVWAMGLSAVCREEQMPNCSSTFYIASSSASWRLGILIAASLVVTLGLPSAMRRFLAISSSDRGSAPLQIEVLFRATAAAAVVGWILESLQSLVLVDTAWEVPLRSTRTVVARSVCGLILGWLFIWWKTPLFLRIQRDQDNTGKITVQVIGFANTYGSSYVALYAAAYALVALTTQLMGHLILATGTIALLSYLEVVDSARDIRQIHAAASRAQSREALIANGQLAENASATAFPTPPPAFSEIMPVLLLAQHMFFGTGHQATLSSIQWKSAFVLTSAVTYPFAPATVVLNTFGPVMLGAAFAPLLAFWNVSPVLDQSSPAASRTMQNAMRVALGVQLYFGTILLGSAASAGLLRRHLMVWKVFSPRFMTAALGLIAAGATSILAVAIGGMRIQQKVQKTFGARRT